MQIRFIQAMAFMFAVAAGTCAAAPAEQSAGPTATQESRWRLGAALGYGLRSNPLVQSDDIPIIVDVDIAWFGEHFFFDNGDFGLTVANNDTLTASLVSRFNSDRVFFGKTDTRFVSSDLTGQPLAQATEFSVPDRDYAIELGLEVLMDGSWGQLQMTAFHDVSNTHDGYEMYVDYGYGWRSQRWYVEPSIGLSYKSAALNDYYWGVRDDEVSVVLPPYHAAAGTNAHARLMMGYQLSRSWTFSLVAEYERLNDSAAASPLVDENDVLGYFAGFGYRFR
jgi:outer membrane protein